MLHLPKIHNPGTSPPNERIHKAKCDAVRYGWETEINALKTRYGITEERLQNYKDASKKLKASTKKLLNWADYSRVIGGFISVKLCETIILSLCLLENFSNFDGIWGYLFGCAVSALFIPLFLAAYIILPLICFWKFIKSFLTELYCRFPSPFHYIFEWYAKRITKKYKLAFQIEEDYTHLAGLIDRKYKDLLRDCDAVWKDECAIYEKKCAEYHRFFDADLAPLFGQDSRYKYEKLVLCDTSNNYVLWECYEAHSKWLQIYIEGLKELARKRQASYWYNLEPREFEIEVALYFERMGYNTKVTPQSNDGGKDIILTREGLTLFVECKHYKKDKIDINIARAFKGVMADAKVEKGILVTLNGVYSNCQTFCERNGISVLTAIDLTEEYDDEIKFVDWEAIRDSYSTRKGYIYDGLLLTGAQFLKESEALDYANKHIQSQAVIAKEPQGSSYIYEVIGVVNTKTWKKLDKIANDSSFIQLYQT